MVQTSMDLLNQLKKMKNKALLVLMEDKYHKMLKRLVSQKSKELNYERRATKTEIITYGIQLAYDKFFNEE